MIKSTKEVKKGIYEIIPLHKIREKSGDVWTEYMHLNTNNGTIIYDRTLGHCLPSPETFTITEFQELISKKGIENINGGLEFKKFINKYPEICVKGIENNRTEFGSGIYKNIYYCVMDDCDENKGGYYIEFHKVINAEIGEIDFDNRIDYMVIHVDNDYEMSNSKKIVEDYIDNLIIELQKDNEENMEEGMIL